MPSRGRGGRDRRQVGARAVEVVVDQPQHAAGRPRVQPQVVGSPAWLLRGRRRGERLGGAARVAEAVRRGRSARRRGSRCRGAVGAERASAPLDGGRGVEPAVPVDRGQQGDGRGHLGIGVRTAGVPGAGRAAAPRWPGRRPPWPASRARRRAAGPAVNAAISAAKVGGGRRVAAQERPDAPRAGPARWASSGSGLSRLAATRCAAALCHACRRASRVGEPGQVVGESLVGLRRPRRPGGAAPPPRRSTQAGRGECAARAAGRPERVVDRGAHQRVRERQRPRVPAPRTACSRSRRAASSTASSGSLDLGQRRPPAAAGSAGRAPRPRRSAGGWRRRTPSYRSCDQQAERPRRAAAAAAPGPTAAGGNSSSSARACSGLPCVP